MRYLDRSTNDEALEAYRRGIPLDRIAGHLGVTTGELRQALGLPRLQSEPVRGHIETGVDLWSADRLQSQL